MKQEIIAKLGEFRVDLLDLRTRVNAITGKTVSKIAIRELADTIATKWVEELRSPLEYKFKIPESVIQETSKNMKRLHVLSRPNNLKESYLEVIRSVLSKYEDKFILPIKQTSIEINTLVDLQKLLPNLPDPSESEYLQEAINCAHYGYKRASIVIGWCAGVDRIQKAIVRIGFEKFNLASIKIKTQTTGKFKNWNKQFSITSLSELQTVFDTDLIVILEGMGLIDGNQVDRLYTCIQYRNHSAHPGMAPIEDTHLLAFFSDINGIIFQNPKL